MGSAAFGYCGSRVSYFCVVCDRRSRARRFEKFLFVSSSLPRHPAAIPATIMLNPFPELLVFGFFAPTILRVTVGFVFLYVAYVQMQQKRASGVFTVRISAAAHLAVGLLLLAGYYTQIAALLGLLGSIGTTTLKERSGELSPLPPSTYILISVILFSLLLSGAGALAFDLPL